MSDLPDLTSLTGEELTDEQLQAILNQIDLDIVNLLRDGKLAALKYSILGSAGRTGDRAANLQSLLNARDHYQQLLESRPTISATQAEFF
ncbi:hypothetical protein [Calycomorphotria hydatis]|uniref:FlgN protein n=1 Tax=Calycomorphotria hydatis TaxID=2528027 RepID=A0A517TFB6_9PLAN|nr:hypothetical protein [Calycomorphotria hydatis]QDT67064.1 hypothetical protein V22_43360 [Calycomorphotria hydatis]